MSPRYLLAVGRDPRSDGQLLRRLSDATGLRTAFSAPGVAALTNAACPCIAVADTGCILGSLFRRSGVAEPLLRLTPSEAQSIAGSDGRALLSSFWGGYVAVVAGSDRVTVLRDPSGTFPCYFASRDGLTFLASDAELLAAAGLAVDVDLEEIGRQLYRAFVPSPATALRGVRELLAGFALRLPGGVDDQRPCWSPWSHVADPGDTLDRAAERLSHCVSDCIRAWAATRGRLLLSVSGGLDSSIIAACLARAGADTVCLTMFTNDTGGDERTYARALCNQLGLRLIERPYRLEDVDIAEPLAPHLPRPRDRTQANAYERVHLEVASEIGANAFVTGNGGDNVFGYSQSAAPIADLYLTQGIGRRMLGSLRDVCLQTGCSIFDALGQAWRLARASPGYRVRPAPLFLSAQFIRTLGCNDLRHPWLDAPASALPGKAAHISAVLRLQPNLESSRGYHLPFLSPLVSQPIIETCFGIPSWQWREGGRDRSVARLAFARDLPPAILQRRVKGTPSRFAARLLDHFRGPIRERLLEGWLASHRIIDRTAVEQVLAGDGPVPDLERVRLLELVNAEAWIGHWLARPRSSDATSDLKGGVRDPLPFSACPTP